MTLALRSPSLVKALIPVDNAPVDANLGSDFRKYLQGMQQIEDAHLTKIVDADKILKQLEEVWRTLTGHILGVPVYTYAEMAVSSHTAVPPYQPRPPTGRRVPAIPCTNQNSRIKPQ